MYPPNFSCIEEKLDTQNMQFSTSVKMNVRLVKEIRDLYQLFYIYIGRVGKHELQTDSAGLPDLTLLPTNRV